MKLVPWLVALPLLLGVACRGAEPSVETKPAASAAEDNSAAQADAAAEAAAAPSLPDAEVLLAKAVEAAGGVTAFESLKSFYYEGHLVVAGQGLEASAKLWWKEGDFYTEQDMTGVGQVRAGKQGDRLWGEDPINGLREIKGLEAEQIAWLSNLVLAADWKRYFTKAETVKEIEIDGAKTYVVRLTSASGADLELQLDAKSGLQTGLALTQETPMGPIPLTLRMKDYRDVGGVKLAYTQVTDMPLATATLTIGKLEVNPEISSARFAMPRADADVVSKRAK